MATGATPSRACGASGAARGAPAVAMGLVHVVLIRWGEDAGADARAAALAALRSLRDVGGVRRLTAGPPARAAVGRRRRIPTMPLHAGWTDRTGGLADVVLTVELDDAAALGVYNVRVARLARGRAPARAIART